MPNSGSALQHRQTRAIAELGAFLERECGAIRLGSDAGPTLTRNGYIEGWRIALHCSGDPHPVDLCLDRNYPFSPPHFVLVNPPPLLTWPHVEENGALCVLNGASTVDPTEPIEVARRLLTEQVYPLIAACESGANQNDFRVEFISYWNRKLSAGAVVLHSLLSPAGPSRPVRIWRGNKFMVAAEEESTLVTWLRNLTGHQKQSYSTDHSCLLWLEQPLLPSDYPQRASDVWRLAQKTPHGGELLHNLASLERLRFPIIIGAPTENGPCFASVTVSAASKREALVAGFRPGHLPPDLLAQRIFCTSETVVRGTVERADAAWIHGRDHDSRQKILRNARIAVVGCGAVGAPVAQQLAMSGVANILLVDPDPLKWSNVGRHVLGAGSVNSKKAEALCGQLRSNFPHSSFEFRANDFETVLSEEPALLHECDLVVCATGAWATESTLNSWHVADSRLPHVVYAWTEPHAAAGHAVAIKKGDSCLQCQMSPRGDANLEVTGWPVSARLLQEPACGAVYQPYGPIELAWTTALVSALVLDCLLGEVTQSTERIWAGPKRLIEENGGWWTPAWISANPGRDCGVFQLERRWETDRNCPQQLVLNEHVLRHFRAYQQISRREVEAGGQLFASFSDGQVIVSKATGPRKSDGRFRTLYIPDRAAEQREIERWHSKGLHYVGDWHTHPSRVPFPSGADLASIRECFIKSRHHLNGFLLIVVGTAEFPRGLHLSLNDGAHELMLSPSETDAHPNRSARGSTSATK